MPNFNALDESQTANVSFSCYVSSLLAEWRQSFGNLSCAAYCLHGQQPIVSEKYLNNNKWYKGQPPMANLTNISDFKTGNISNLPPYLVVINIWCGWNIFWKLWHCKTWCSMVLTNLYWFSCWLYERYGLPKRLLMWQQRLSSRWVYIPFTR